MKIFFFQSETIKEAFRRLQIEVLENVELQDFRLHVYTVFHIMKHRIDHNFEGSSFVIQINEAEKTNLVMEYVAIAQDKMFISLKTALEATYHSKGLKVKVPSFLDSLNDFLNSEYLKSTFNRYKKLIEHNSQPQTHLLTSDVPNRKKHVRNLLKQGSQQRINPNKGNSVITEPNMDIMQQMNLQRQIKESHIRQTVYGNNRQRSNNARPSIALLHDIKPLKIAVDQTAGEAGEDHNQLRGSHNNSPAKQLLTEYDDDRVQQVHTFQSDQDLAAIASKNHAIATQNSFARNPAILAVGIHPNTSSDGKFTLAHNSTEPEQNLLILPVLEPYRKGQPKEVYLQKLQPYLQGSKLVNKPLIPKRVHQLAQLHGVNQQTSQTQQQPSSVLLNLHQPPKKTDPILPLGKQTSNAQVLAKAYNQQAYLRRVTRGSNASSGKASLAPTAGGGRNNNDSIDHGRSFDNLGLDPMVNNTNIDDPYQTHGPALNRQSLPGGSQSDRKSPMGKQMPVKMKTPNKVQSNKIVVEAGEYHLPAIQDAQSQKNGSNSKKETESRFMQVRQSIKAGDINTANANLFYLSKKL